MAPGPSSSTSYHTSWDFPLAREEIGVARIFVAKRTFPLLLQEPDGVRFKGCGFLYDVAGHLAIVSASHVFDELFLKYEYDLNRVQIPLLPDGYTISFPEGNLVQCQHDPHRTGTPLDIGAYLVNDLGCAAKLRQSFVPVGRSLASEALTDSYLVAGYPDSRIENVDECTLHSNGGVLIMATTEYTGITFHDKGPYDLYLTNRAKARTAKGERIDVPDLGGLSGSVVWQVAQPRAGIWTADDKLIPVGVQAAVSSGRYARVVRWAAVEVAVQAAILGRGGIAAPCAEP